MAEKMGSNPREVGFCLSQGGVQVTVTQAGYEIALSWSPMRLKILHWQPEFHNWSPVGD